VDFAPWQYTFPHSISSNSTFGQKQIPVLEHPPYILASVPQVFHVPKTIKICLKGSHFVSLEDIQRMWWEYWKVLQKIISCNIYKDSRDNGMHV
jgi:hypothetical protein